MYGVGILISSLLTIITPQMAYLNLWALVVCRVIAGLFEVSKESIILIVIMLKLKGMTYPAGNEMLGKWAPPLERSKMGTMAVGGISQIVYMLTDIC